MCTYCDFYKEKTHTVPHQFLTALKHEIILRRDYLPSKNIETIYFGGGTPSIMTASDINDLLTLIRCEFDVSTNVEITFEANPDDLNLAYLSELQTYGVNRLSIGIQSFNNVHLHQLNRRHDSQQAKQSVVWAQQCGFDNISVDLIFGISGQTLENWNHTIDAALELKVQHISVYGLTFEPNTSLYQQKLQGLYAPTDDELMIEMYQLVSSKLEKNGFLRYEISNFSMPNLASKHNTSYWRGIPYLGVGPSAHSYNGFSRQWNVSSVNEYCTLVMHNQPYYEIEVMTLNEQYNEYIMISLRTSAGVNVQHIENIFGKEYVTYCMLHSQLFLEKNWLLKDGNCLTLSENGIQMCNAITSSLMKTD